MLDQALRRLESQLSRAEPLRRALRPGLAPGRIESKARVLPFPLPEEVRTLYAWRDGTTRFAPDFVAGYRLLPLDSALKLYRSQRRLARQVAGTEAADDVWSPRWLPLLQMDGQQFLVIVGEEEPGEQAPLHRLFIQDGTPLECFATVADLVDHVATCLERNGYTYDGGQLEENRAIVAEVRRERQPERVEELLRRLRAHPSPGEMLGLGQELEELRDPRFVDELLLLLDSPEASFELQKGAAAALGPLEDRRAVEPLLAKLESAHPQLAGSIVSSLMWLGDRRAEEPIREILTTARNQDLRQRAIVALGALGGEESLRLLEGMLEEELSIRERTAILTALKRRGVGDYAPPGPEDFAKGGGLRAQVEREIAQERDPLARAARENALRVLDQFGARPSFWRRAGFLLRALLWTLFRGRG